MADDIELPPNERYELMKLRLLAEVQGDLTTWAKRRIWLLLAAVTLVGFFGIGGSISLTVGQSIEKKMESVNAHVLAAIKSSVEAELSARQATKSAETETRKVNETVTKLRETLESISKEASKTEDQLKTLSMAVESRSENVRGESRLLTDALERRLANLEQLTQKLARLTDAASIQDLQASVTTLEAKAKREGPVHRKFQIWYSNYLH
jgi:chromosome segregation ATPase